MEYFEFASVTDGFRMTIAHDHRGPQIDLEYSLPSEVIAISPFVDKLMPLLRNCGCVPEDDSDVEVALREALANAIIHGNHEDRRKHVHVTCRCEPDEVAIAVKDEGSGFDINTVPDPATRENIESAHGRGILVMKALMDEVRFEEGGVVVHMRKSAGEAPKR
jgi:serine/threonine-protein kinase RsbW